MSTNSTNHSFEKQIKFSFNSAINNYIIIHYTTWNILENNSSLSYPSCGMVISNQQICITDGSHLPIFRSKLIRVLLTSEKSARNSKLVRQKRSKSLKPRLGIKYHSSKSKPMKSKVSGQLTSNTFCHSSRW